MKFYPLALTYLAFPILALAQAPNPSGNPAPAAAIPTPTATVDMARAPKIFCGIPKHDFGTVDEGPDITHLFTVRNKGKSDLKITDVHTSCGCTAGVVMQNGVEKHPSTTEPLVVPPLGKTVVKGTFHTANHPGKIQKIIFVGSNDPVTPSYQLELDMNVVRDVDMMPNSLYFFNAKHGQPHSSALTVLGRPGVPLEITSVESKNHVVTVTSVTPYKDEKENRSGATIQVDVPVTQPIGSFSDSLDIKTSSPKKPEVTVNVNGEVVGSVQYNPKSLNFQAGQGGSQTISFTPENPAQFAIRRVESVNHLVRPAIVRGVSNGVEQYSLTATAVKSLPKDSDGKDQIKVYTNDAEMPVISIDVQVNK